MSGPAVIVVGAGVVGAACAEALAEAGCRVTVLESAFPGAGATGAAMGHLVVMDDSEAQFALTSWSRRLWAERAASLPPDAEDHACGTLWIAADEEEMRLVRGKAAFYEARGETVEVLDARALREAEPQLRQGLAGALRVPADRVVYPPAAAAVFLDGARRHGAEVLSSRRVEALVPGRALCGGRWIEADAVVNAAGAEAPRLLPGLPVVPRKGHLVITDRYPGFLSHQVIELGYLKSAHTLAHESVAFNLQPRRTGQVLVGSSRELVGWDSSVNRPLCERMLRRAVAVVPGLSRLRALRTWVGFRPATPDGLPLVGAWEPGLWVAAGHEGLGVTTAPGTARLVADLVLGRTPPIDPSPFDPRRKMPALA
ncbi:MAG TPA: FAD-dependent oxidoreductase [Vicinamibacteria bacterium]|nr:FAD-dependent oxidoreductase [Vicinamibacteria bacterium]